jgi:hypothetical protein
MTAMVRIDSTGAVAYSSLMAARIDHAVLAAAPSQKITAFEYDPAKHSAVLCPLCGCIVQGVRATTRQVNDEQIAVTPYFRLPPNAEKNGKGHTDQCRFNVKVTVEWLVAASREIKNFDNSPEMLCAGAKHTAEFRLHILMELLRQLPAGVADDLDEDNHSGAKTGNRYTRSSRTITPYLRLAKEVLLLMARIQSSPELGKWIILKYADKSIPWKNYFYDLGDYHRLYDYIRKQKSTKSRRPVAVVVKLGPVSS